MISQLNSFAFIVVRRHCKDSGRGDIIKSFATFRAAFDYAKQKSACDNNYFYWAMPRTDY